MTSTMMPFKRHLPQPIFLHTAKIVHTEGPMQSPNPAIDSPTDTIQVGRQAIFDRELKIFAYELLYRDAGGRCLISDGDRASSVTLLNAFM